LPVSIDLNMIIKTVMSMELLDNKGDIQKINEQVKVLDSVQQDKVEPSEPKSPTLPADRSSYGEEQNLDEEHRQKEQEALTATVMSLFMNLCSVIRTNYAQKQRKIRPKADRKLLRMIRKKEISLGHKYDEMDMKM